MSYSNNMQEVAKQNPFNLMPTRTAQCSAGGGNIPIVNRRQQMSNQSSDEDNSDKELLEHRPSPSFSPSHKPSSSLLHRSTNMFFQRLGGRRFTIHMDILTIACAWLSIYFSILWVFYDSYQKFMYYDHPEGPHTHEDEPKDSCEYGSAQFYMYCGLGGVLSCGITHTAVVPLDMVKCRIQVDPKKYKGMVTGFRVTVAEEGVRALAKGWAPTAIGYSMQGLGKFGFYEMFKVLYGNMMGEELAFQYRTTLYLIASASAEFFADMLLAPMEACKVRIQTMTGVPTTLRGMVPYIYKSEGINGFYKGLPPLWLRQIPYTMMKFACFERTVEAIYQYVMPKPRAECTKSEQLMVTFASGYIAGVFCALVSHPADSVVSVLNKEKGASAMGVAKKLGWSGLWAGLGPRIIMIGTLTALQWFIYDSFKVALMLPRPPPPAMPASLKAKLEAAGKL